MQSPRTRATTLVFIDATLPDLHLLQAGVPREAEVHLLPAGSHGLDFIAHQMAGRSGIEALHLIAHGAPGQLRLGSYTLSRATLRADMGALDVIRDAMTEDGQWLMYGCDVAAGDEGRSFVEALELTTGLQVAAWVKQP